MDITYLPESNFCCCTLNIVSRTYVLHHLAVTNSAHTHKGKSDWVCMDTDMGKEDPHLCEQISPFSPFSKNKSIHTLPIGLITITNKCINHNLLSFFRPSKSVNVNCRSNTRRSWIVRFYFVEKCPAVP